MSILQYRDYQFEIYFDGLEGQLPKYPVDFASLERKAAEVLPLVGALLRRRWLW
jgi:lactate 2-monooxygenase